MVKTKTRKNHHMKKRSRSMRGGSDLEGSEYHGAGNPGPTGEGMPYSSVNLDNTKLFSGSYAPVDKMLHQAGGKKKRGTKKGKSRKSLKSKSNFSRKNKRSVRKTRKNKTMKNRK